MGNKDLRLELNVREKTLQSCDRQAKFCRLLNSCNS